MHIPSQMSNIINADIHISDYPWVRAGKLHADRYTSRLGSTMPICYTSADIRARSHPSIDRPAPMSNRARLEVIKPITPCIDATTHLIRVIHLDAVDVLGAIRRPFGAHVDLDADLLGKHAPQRASTPAHKSSLSSCGTGRKRPEPNHCRQHHAPDCPSALPIGKGEKPHYTPSLSHLHRNAIITYE